MRALVPLAVAAVLAVDPTSASAYRAGAGTFGGTGHTNVPIGTVPAPAALGIAGSATLYGPYGNLSAAGFDNGTVVPCQLQTNGTESTAAGFGALYGNCGPVAFDRCAYVRVVAVWSVACSNGTTAEWVFSPHQMNPITSFTVTGTISYAVAP